ncbi:MAG: NADH-quinone oxidoreductase subunit C [Candidatus Omnitrophota bacterium]
MNPVDAIKEKLGKKILDVYEHRANRIYIKFEPADIPEAVEYIFKDLGLRFAIASGIDTPAGFEILYHFSHDKTGKMITLKTLIKDKKNPRIKSITPIFVGAEWIEREMWELLGIEFEGHPNLTRLLIDESLPEDFHPLRQEER